MRPDRRPPASAAILLALFALAPVLRCQLPKDDPVEAQKRWYERARERPDLIPGAFEVLRFPTGYVFEPRYRHDEKDRKRILNPDFYCNRCVAEGRIPPADDREGHRMMERSEPDVVAWIEGEVRSRQVTHLEDGDFKLVCDLPGVNLKLFWNPHLEDELRELGDVFPEVTEKTAQIDSHMRAHLYLIRAHRLLRDFLWMVGTDQETFRKTHDWLGPYLGMNNKQEVYLFQRQRPYMGFCKRYIGRVVSDDGQCWHLFQDRAMILTMHAQNRKDPENTNFFLHRLMHNLLDAYRMYSFKLPAWLQMGMGHWVERRENAEYNSFCYSEGTIPRLLYEDRWAPKVKRMLRKGDVVPFVSACARKEYGEFPPEYHMVVHSWVCYLWRLGPEKMQVFLNTLKDKREDETIYQAQVAAFRKAYGINLLQFDEGWRQWVEDVYPDM